MSLFAMFRNADWFNKNPVSEILLGLYTGGNCLGYFDLVVDNTVAVGLPSIPAGCYKALLVVEADATTTDMTKIIRFREDAVAPVAAVGIPLGNLSIYEVGGLQNLANFKVIGIEVGKSHTIRIQYYG